MGPRYARANGLCVQAFLQPPIINEADCIANGGVWAGTHKSGSHNLVVGNQHNYSSYGGFVAGWGWS